MPTPSRRESTTPGPAYVRTLQSATGSRSRCSLQDVTIPLGRPPPPPPPKHKMLFAAGTPPAPIPAICEVAFLSPMHDMAPTESVFMQGWVGGRVLFGWRWHTQNPPPFLPFFPSVLWAGNRGPSSRERAGDNRAVRRRRFRHDDRRRCHPGLCQVWPPPSLAPFPPFPLSQITSGDG